MTVGDILWKSAKKFICSVMICSGSEIPKAPRLDNVRERDIEIIEREGESVVLPDTGGISAFSKMNPRLRGTWWKCSAGMFYSLELRVVCDRERGTLRHYSIQPAFPMTLRLYQEKLREFAGNFERVQFF